MREMQWSDLLSESRRAQVWVCGRGLSLEMENRMEDGVRQDLG